MVEKKATKTAVKKTATKKATTAKTATAAKKTTATAAAKTEVIYLNAENAGFRAGDVYQALAAAENALSLEEMANISIEDTILGIGWLFKEGKIKSEDNKVALA